MRPLVHQYIKGDIAAENVFLFSSCAINLERNNKSFELAEHNILKSFNNKYNIIRAMNILNLSYFTDEEFQIIIKNIYHGLADNALFITGSN